jgi:sugar O-acyltransferase (sialic acid O-acetyltransferase NeuD family)
MMGTSSDGKRPVVVFGIGPQPAMFAQYIEEDGRRDVAAFTVDRPYIIEDTFEGKPLIPFDEIIQRFPPSSYDMFVAVGYSQRNRLRRDKYLAAKAAGYRLPSFVSPQASFRSQLPCGDNCMIMEFATVHPYARIGSNVTMLSGSVVAHHSTVADHSFLAVHTSVAGHCQLDERVFLGQASAVISGARIGEGAVIGAGALVGSDVPPDSVWVPARSTSLNVDPDSLRY